MLSGRTSTSVGWQKRRFGSRQCTHEATAAGIWSTAEDRRRTSVRGPVSKKMPMAAKWSQVNGKDVRPLRYDVNHFTTAPSRLLHAAADAGVCCGRQCRTLPTYQEEATLVRSLDHSDRTMSVSTFSTAVYVKRWARFDDCRSWRRPFSFTSCCATTS